MVAEERNILPNSSPCQTSAWERIAAFIASSSFPCVGAKSALRKERIRFSSFGQLGNPENAGELCQHLQAFSAEFPEPRNLPVSLIALFDGDFFDEISFEAALWAQLQAMHDFDSRHFSWDSSVSADPSSPEFSMSIAGRAFFVVGLHPNASRMARRAPVPCLVFNFHNQFESLRASGKYQSMQATIRERDIELQGSINPVLSRFGEASEASQYSGRAVETHWRCPFHHEVN